MGSANVKKEAAGDVELDLSGFSPKAVEQTLLYVHTKTYVDSKAMQSASTAIRTRGKPIGKLNAPPRVGPYVTRQSRKPTTTDREPRWVLADKRKRGTSPSTLPTDAVTCTLMTSIQVYALAQTYGLRDLASMVVVQIMSREEEFRDCDLAQVVKTLLDDIERNDIMLRMWFLDRCIANYGVIRKYHPDVEHIILKHEPVVWRMGLARLQEAGVAKMVATMTEMKLLIKDVDAQRARMKAQAASRDRALRALFDDVHLLSFEKTTLKRELAEVKDTCQILKNEVTSLTSDEEAENGDEEYYGSLLPILQDYVNAMDIHDLKRRYCNCGAAITSCAIESEPDIDGRITLRCLCETEHVFSSQTNSKRGKTVKVTDWVQSRPG